MHLNCILMSPFLNVVSLAFLWFEVTKGPFAP